MERGGLLARGRTAEVYARGEGEVLKLFYDWCPADWVAREVELSKAVESKDLPAPRCLGTVIVDGRQGIVYERVRGPSMLTAMTARPWTLGRQARAFAALHALVHSRDGEGLSPLAPYLAKSISGQAGLPVRIKERALEALTGLEEGASLCHFDFHPGQIVLSPAGPVILDWMTAFRGNPAADVARTMVLLRFSHAPGAGWMMRTVLDAARRSFRSAYLRHYHALRPETEPAEVDRWLVPVAAARLAEGIADERAAILAFLDAACKTI